MRQGRAGFGAQGAGLVSGMGCLGGSQGDPDLGRGPDLLVRRDLEAFRDCLGWGSESEAGACAVGGGQGVKTEGSGQ